MIAFSPYHDKLYKSYSWTIYLQLIPLLWFELEFLIQQPKAGWITWHLSVTPTPTQQYSTNMTLMATLSRMNRTEPRCWIQHQKITRPSASKAHHHQPTVLQKMHQDGHDRKSWRVNTQVFIDVDLCYLIDNRAAYNAGLWILLWAISQFTAPD